jgi:hypothetical protein
MAYESASRSLILANSHGCRGTQVQVCLKKSFWEFDTYTELDNSLPCARLLPLPEHKEQRSDSRESRESLETSWTFRQLLERPKEVFSNAGKSPFKTHRDTLALLNTGRCSNSNIFCARRWTQKAGRSTPRYRRPSVDRGMVQSRRPRSAAHPPALLQRLAEIDVAQPSGALVLVQPS